MKPITEARVEAKKILMDTLKKHLLKHVKRKRGTYEKEPTIKQAETQARKSD